VRRGVALVVLAACGWGTWSLFLRPSGLPATITSPGLFLIIGLLTLPRALRLPPATWDRRTVLLMAGLVAADAVNVLAFFAAIGKTSVQIAVLTHYLAPVLLALAAGPIEGVRVRGIVPAALVAFAGLAVVLDPSTPPPIGALLGVVSAIGYAANVLIARRLAATLDPWRSTSYHCLLAFVALAPLAWGDLGAVTLRGSAIFALGGVIVGTGCGLIYLYGLMRIGSARAGVLAFFEPLVAVAVGALVWGEVVHPAAALGGAAVLGAGIYVARQTR
jgi:drug/metabolite transporter (DMT)-like permease